ncbi:tetratricopeptide repeat protein [Streptomyces sp. P01-B04]|nr:tetratricopeptide repeat protein [Streptomyces poriferorum]
MSERVAEARTRVLGPEDPDTLETVDMLADLYNDMGRDREALAMRGRAAETRARVGWN